MKNKIVLATLACLVMSNSTAVPRAYAGQNQCDHALQYLDKRIELAKSSIAGEEQTIKELAEDQEDANSLAFNKSFLIGGVAVALPFAAAYAGIQAAGYAAILMGKLGIDGAAILAATGSANLAAASSPFLMMPAGGIIGGLAGLAGSAKLLAKNIKEDLKAETREEYTEGLAAIDVRAEASPPEAGALNGEDIMMEINESFKPLEEADADISELKRSYVKMDDEAGYSIGWNSVRVARDSISESEARKKLQHKALALALSLKPRVWLECKRQAEPGSEDEVLNSAKKPGVTSRKTASKSDESVKGSANDSSETQAREAD